MSPRRRTVTNDRVLVDAACAKVASSQHGIITWDQALLAGASPDLIKHRVRAGRWVRIEHGVYLVAGVPFTWHVRVLANCLASAGLATHRTGAVLWGLRDFRPGPPEIAIERGRSFRRDGIRVHESTDLVLAEPRKIAGIPTTGINRLLVDLGAVVPAQRVEDAVFESIDRKLTTWPALLTALALHARRGRDGVGALRAVLEQNYGTSVPQSVLEVTVERLLDDAALPRPTRQIEVHDERGFVARIDLGYERAMVALEVDGRSVHARRLAFDADNEKRNRLRLAGWLLLVITSEMILRKPMMISDHVRRGLELSRTNDLRRPEPEMSSLKGVPRP